MTKNFFIGAFLFVFAVGVWGSYSIAQTPNKDYVKPMPEMEFLEEGAFAEQTRVQEETPPDFESLRYFVRYPEDWTYRNNVKEGSFFLDPKVFSELATFFGPPRVTGHRSRMTISALQLDYKLTSEQWLLQHLLSSGSTVEGFRVHSESRAEALQVIVDRGVSYAVRSVVEINGKNLAFVEYFLPVENWEKEKILQAQVVDSFSLLNRDDDAFVEEMATFEFLDIAKVLYPSSWSLRAPPLRSVDLMEAALLNAPLEAEGSLSESGSVNGKIEIKLVSAYTSDSLEVEIENFKEGLASRGIGYGEDIDVRGDVTFNDNFEFARLNAYKIDDESGRLSDYEIWVAMLSAQDYFYFVTLLTPSSSSDYFLWSRNTQTYKLVLELVEPKVDFIVAEEDDSVTDAASDQDE